jgi:hypothetical protein
MKSGLEDKERGYSAGRCNQAKPVPGAGGIKRSYDAERSEGEYHLQSEWSVKIPLSTDVSL